MPKILLSANTDWFLYNFRLALARFLRDSGYEVVLVSPTGKYISRFEENGFRWIRWNVSRKQANPFEEVDALLSLLRIYRKEKPDIVHHHTIKPVLYGSIAARIVGVARIVNSITGRGYVFQSEKVKARLLRSVVTFLYRIALGFSNCFVIFENDFDRKFFIDSGFLPERRSFLIEGVGVDPEQFFPMPEEESTPMVLMCSRMLWDKGVGVFLEVARQVKTKVKARFVLVGSPDPGNPESIPENMLHDWNEEGIVEWWGWQPDMPSVYHQSHIIALPTYYGEGVPTALIEGAACGKPLVASDIPGCQAIVKNDLNGYLIPPNDAEAFALALEQLISSPGLRKEMGENSRRLFLEKFTHSTINQATLQVYEK